MIDGWFIRTLRMAAVAVLAGAWSVGAQTAGNPGSSPSAAPVTAGGTDTATPRTRRTVVCFGVYTECYRLDRVLTNCNLVTANAMLSGVKDLPAAGEWAGVDVLILSDVSGAEFSSNQVQEIRAFVADGGGLLTLGGPFTYGLGAFRAKGIEELLPVEGAPFDLTREEKGAVLTAGTEPHPVLEGVSFAARPMVYWLHRETLKPGAEVLIRAGERPLLVAGAYGKGRVLCFTGTPLGQPAEGQVPFWDWEAWPLLVSNMAAWLRASPRGAGNAGATTGREVSP